MYETRSRAGKERRRLHVLRFRRLVVVPYLLFGPALGVVSEAEDCFTICCPPPAELADHAPEALRQLGVPFRSLLMVRIRFEAEQFLAAWCVRSVLVLDMVGERTAAA